MIGTDEHVRLVSPQGPPQADRPLRRSSRPVVAPGVVFAEVDGDTVLLDGQAGAYYALNPVGTRLWALIVVGAALGEIHDTLLEEYDVPADVLWADLARLVGEMKDTALVTIECELERGGNAE